jgi:hypothetical protein
LKVDIGVARKTNTHLHMFRSFLEGHYIAFGDLVLEMGLEVDAKERSVRKKEGIFICDA